MSRLLSLLALVLALALWLAPAPTRAETPPGPPFPDPIVDQAVYDTAGLFDAPTITEAESIIDRIEQRSGAEVVVYTQVKPEATAESTEADAIDLIDQ